MIIIIIIIIIIIDNFILFQCETNFAFLLIRGTYNVQLTFTYIKHRV